MEVSWKEEERPPPKVYFMYINACMASKLNDTVWLVRMKLSHFPSELGSRSYSS